MLPAPPASCAGWWFSQLWRSLLYQQPPRLGSWTWSYPQQGMLFARPSAAEAGLEVIAGSLHEGETRRCTVSWEWPGDEGMLHTVSFSWQLGETLVRPLEWAHLRRPLPVVGRMPAAPWPLHLSIAVHGWHGQFLELAEIRVTDGERSYPVQWEPPPGRPRLPRTELPCVLSEQERGQAPPTLTLAGLSLPWQIDVDRDAWILWRRLNGGALLELLGGAAGSCPRHGPGCPWPETGRAA